MGSNTATAIAEAPVSSAEEEAAALQAAALFSRGFDLELARIAAALPSTDSFRPLIGRVIFAQAGPFRYRVDGAVLPTLEWDRETCHAAAERAVSELHARLVDGLDDRAATATVGLIHQLISDFQVDVDWFDDLAEWIPVASAA
ncbi:hypothetical protein [Arthrobacter sp. A2-55]|uniref:hypothetical protein n=1 Tax=Arthrobacter sp. A2-55 TaxID=2897337 RepID=UPI0021CD9A53|nr:hypothetical protein [Arthrobacter sp. A2-55]MCU6480543.1 hypothetical protein [Arthrobacter sp. A2-55]